MMSTVCLVSCGDTLYSQYLLQIIWQLDWGFSTPCISCLLSAAGVQVGDEFTRSRWRLWKTTPKESCLNNQYLVTEDWVEQLDCLGLVAPWADEAVVGDVPVAEGGVMREGDADGEREDLEGDREAWAMSILPHQQIQVPLRAPQAELCATFREEHHQWDQSPSFSSPNSPPLATFSTNRSFQCTEVHSACWRTYRVSGK